MNWHCIRVSPTLTLKMVSHGMHGVMVMEISHVILNSLCLSNTKHEEKVSEYYPPKGPYPPPHATNCHLATTVLLLSLSCLSIVINIFSEATIPHWQPGLSFSGLCGYVSFPSGEHWSTRDQDRARPPARPRARTNHSGSLQCFGFLRVLAGFHTLHCLLYFSGIVMLVLIGSQIEKHPNH